MTWWAKIIANMFWLVKIMRNHLQKLRQWVLFLLAVCSTACFRCSPQLYMFPQLPAIAS